MGSKSGSDSSGNDSQPSGISPMESMARVGDTSLAGISSAAADREMAYRDSGDSDELYTPPSTGGGPTGWSGDSGVDAEENQPYNRQEYSGATLSGTYGTPDKPASRTITYGTDGPSEDIGRPDITYVDPGESQYKAKYELNQIKHIQNQKLNTVKNKLIKAGFDISKDANFAETKAFINDLSSDELPNSYKDLKKSDGTPFYSPETIAKWEKSGYIPEAKGATMPGLIGAAIDIIPGKQLTRDELWSDLDMATEVGKSGGGNMDWQERMKTYSPNQYATMMGGLNYNPITKEFSVREGGSENLNAFIPQASHFVGGTQQQPSMVNQYFANQQSSGMSDVQKAYDQAKANLNMTLTPNTQQFGYSDPFPGGYTTTNLTNNPYNIDYMKDRGLI